MALLSHNSSLRSEPSSDSKLLQSLPADTAVTIISKCPRTGYVKIKTEDGEKEPAGSAMNLAPVACNSLTGDPEIYPNVELTPGAVNGKVKQSMRLRSYPSNLAGESAGSSARA